MPESLFYLSCRLTRETLLKKRLAQVFPSEFCEIFKNTFFYRTPLVTAFGYRYFILNSHRSSRPEVLCEKGVLGNFTNFTSKHLCQSLFFKKVAGPGPSGVYQTTGFLLTTSYLSFVSKAVYKSKIFRVPLLLVMISYRKDRTI